MKKNWIIWPETKKNGEISWYTTNDSFKTNPEEFCTKKTVVYMDGDEKKVAVMISDYKWKTPMSRLTAEEAAFLKGKRFKVVGTDRIFRYGADGIKNGIYGADEYQKVRNTAMEKLLKEYNEYAIADEGMERTETYHKALNGNYYEALSYEAQKARGKALGVGIQTARFNCALAEWLSERIGLVNIYQVMLKANELFCQSRGVYPETDKVWLNELCYELLVTVEDKAWMEFPPEEKEAQDLLAYMSLSELTAIQIF